MVEYMNFRRVSIYDKYHVYCKVCSSTLSVMYGGVTQLRRHNETKNCNNKRENIAKNSQLTATGFLSQQEKRVKRAEILLAAAIAKEDLAMNKSNNLVESCRHIFTDSSIAQEVSNSRTKSTAIIRNILSPVFFDEMVSKLIENKFGLMVDETTDISKTSVIALRVRFFDGNELHSNLLKVLPYTDGTADGLFKLIDSFFNNYQIPYENLTSYCSDGAAVVSGDNNSLKTRLIEKTNDLFVVKCLSHTAHLIAAHACEELPDNLNKFMNNICSYFSNSAKRNREFESIQKCYEVPIHKLIRKADTRWLSMEQCVNRIVEQWEPLKTYFMLETGDSRNEELVKDIVSELTSRTTYAFLLLLKNSLAYVIQFNLIFQSDNCQIQRMVTESQNLFLLFVSCIVKSSYIKSMKK
jgi:hypothetical protein